MDRITELELLIRVYEANMTSVQTRCTELLLDAQKSRRENMVHVENLSSTQARCTELLIENRALKKKLAEYESGLTLPGWTCASCQGFNGSAKEERTECRGCGAVRIP